MRSLLFLLMALAMASCRAGEAPAAATPTEGQKETAAGTATAIPAPTQDPWRDERRRMVQEGIIGWGITDPAVIAVMGSVPRHEFVPSRYQDAAYVNQPLPIGHGQTISQPYIVALMTQELEVETGDRVLEIGTGSGYQAAVLAELGLEVYSIEIIGPLADEAAERLRRLGYDEVRLRHGDGYFGWPEAAPFDAIMVTAAPDHVPPPLLGQLAVGAVMVIPVGPPGGYQELWKITRAAEDRYESASLGGVRFVPLTRQEASP